VQAFVADLAELAEDLEVSTGLGQHAAWLEEQLVEIAMPTDVFGLERLGHRSVSSGFVDAVLLVDVYRFDLQLLAQLEQHLWRLMPVGGGTDQQGYVQFAQRVAEHGQVAQPEIHLARGIVVLQPLLRAQQVDGHARATASSGRERGVVVQAQVAAQPDQLHAGVR